MAGVKGRSGGARPNTGGVRPGAGRPPKPAPTVSVDEKDDSVTFLLGVMSDPDADARLRIDAAKALLPYQHRRIGEQGKKDERKDAAEAAGKGRFKSASPPKLVISNA